MEQEGRRILNEIEHTSNQRSCDVGGRNPLFFPQEIYEIIASNSHDDGDEKLATARHAANLSMTSREIASTMAAILYDMLDPGCVKNLAEKRIKREIDSSYFFDRAIELAEEEDSLATLRAKCSRADIAVSGTKAKLAERLSSASAAAEEEARIARKYDKKISEFACPVRDNVRRQIKADETRLVTATDARSIGATESMLSQLPCEYRNNPHGRHAPPMRLFNLCQVWDAIVFEKGSGWHFFEKSAVKNGRTCFESKNVPSKTGVLALNRKMYRTGGYVLKKSLVLIQVTSAASSIWNRKSDRRFEKPRFSPPS